RRRAAIRVGEDGARDRHFANCAAPQNGGVSSAIWRRVVSQVNLLPLAPAKARSARAFVDAELLPVVVAEIELGQIAVKMLFLNVLINADQSAFKHRKEVLKRVGMHIAAHPFLF